MNDPAIKCKKEKKIFTEESAWQISKWQLNLIVLFS
jgi:hypothetical protein